MALSAKKESTDENLFTTLDFDFFEFRSSLLSEYGGYSLCNE